MKKYYRLRLNTAFVFAGDATNPQFQIYTIPKLYKPEIFVEDFGIELLEPSCYHNFINIRSNLIPEDLISSDRNDNFLWSYPIKCEYQYTAAGAASHYTYPYAGLYHKEITKNDIGMKITNTQISSLTFTLEYPEYDVATGLHSQLILNTDFLRDWQINLLIADEIPDV